MQFFNQIYENKARTILWKKMKNKYDPKIEMVKYLELIDQNKIWLLLNTASKVYTFPRHVSSHSIFNTFSPNFKFLKFGH